MPNQSKITKETIGMAEKTKHVYISVELHRRIKAYAAVHGLTISGALEFLLTDVLPEVGNGKKPRMRKKAEKSIQSSQTPKKISSLIKHFGTDRMVEDFLSDAE